MAGLEYKLLNIFGTAVDHRDLRTVDPDNGVMMYVGPAPAVGGEAKVPTGCAAPKASASPRTTIWIFFIRAPNSHLFKLFN